MRRRTEGLGAIHDTGGSMPIGRKQNTLDMGLLRFLVDLGSIGQSASCDEREEGERIFSNSNRGTQEWKDAMYDQTGRTDDDKPRDYKKELADRKRHTGSEDF
jgi:hypothetical protein